MRSTFWPVLTHREREILEALVSALDDLKTAVDNNTTAVQAAVAAGIGGATGTPDSELEPLVAQLTANNDALSGATSGTSSAAAVTGEQPADVGASVNPPA